MFQNFGNGVGFNIVTPQSLSASANGTGVDTQNYDGVGRVTVNIGAVGGTSPTVDFKMQSSPDNSTWTDISGAAITTVTASNATAVVDIDLGACSRYVRGVATLGGTSPTAVMSATMTAMVKQ